MSYVDFRLPVLFDYTAKFAWASSGAVVGIEKHFDIVGLCLYIMALLCCTTGGGLIRDGILLQRNSPSLLINPGRFAIGCSSGSTHESAYGEAGH